MKSLLTVLIFFIAISLNGQVVLFNNIYQKTDWDYADAVIERSDGNYLVLGSSRSQFGTDYDINLLLVDYEGNIIWDRYIGESGKHEFGYSLIETSDRNYLISGSSGSYPYLVKVDPEGNLIWDQEFDGAGGGGYSVGETIDNNYFFIASAAGSNSIVYLTNSQGNLISTNTYGIEFSSAIIQTTDNGFVLAGNSPSVNGDNDIVLLKIDTNGNQEWSKSFGGGGEDGARTVEQLSDDGYLIGGYFDSQIPDDVLHTYLIRTNSIGDTLWTRTFEISVPHYLKKLNNDNGFVISTEHFDAWCGCFSVSITKLDELGNTIWHRGFGSNSTLEKIGNNVTETSDGGFLLTGSTKNISPSTPADMRLMKLDSLGNFVLSIIDNKKDSSLISVFPNPARNEINFEFNSTIGKQIKQIEIFSSLGQKLKKITSLEETNLKVNIESFVDGLYFYKITTVKNQIITGKFLVKK